MPSVPQSPARFEERKYFYGWLKNNIANNREVNKSTPIYFWSFHNETAAETAKITQDANYSDLYFIAMLLV